jgi:hypothetical protein
MMFSSVPIQDAVDGRESSCLGKRFTAVVAVKDRSVALTFISMPATSGLSIRIPPVAT